jgi:hypothetical protein
LTHLPNPSTWGRWDDIVVDVNKYTLFCDADSSVILDLPQNKGICDVLASIKDLRRLGIAIEHKNSATTSATDLEHDYAKAIVPSVYRKYRVRQMFGSSRRAGLFFGRGVPALWVHPDGDDPGDIYPHEKDGRIVTISEFLTKLASVSNRD